MSSFSLLVDAAGNPCAGTFGSTLPTSNIAGVTTGQSAGLCMGGLQAGTNKLSPLMLDATGALVIRQALAITMGVFPPLVQGTGTAAGRSMMSFWNGSQTNTLRFLAFTATCPPQVNTSGTLLGLTGTTTTYTQVMFGAYRISNHTGGAAASFVAHDPSDDALVDTAISIRLGATITGENPAPLVVWDAAYNSRLAIGGRADQNAKVWTMPPNSGLHVKCLSSLQANVNFYLGAVVAQNIA